MTTRVNVLGVGVSVLNLRTAVDAIADAVRARRKGCICVTGVHGVMEAQNDPVFRKILNEAFLARPTECRWSGWAKSAAIRIAPRL